MHRSSWQTILPQKQNATPSGVAFFVSRLCRPLRGAREVAPKLGNLKQQAQKNSVRTRRTLCEVPGNDVPL